RRLLPHLRNAQGIDEAVERDLAPSVDGVLELPGALLAPAFALCDHSRVEAEDVGRRADELVLPECGEVLVAQPLDIEGVARHEMTQPLDHLRRADQPAGAAPGRLALLAHGEAAADRAAWLAVAAARDLGRQVIRLAALRPALEHHRDDLRDDVAGTLHDDRVALADVLARDLVLVVQGGALDDDAADGDRRQLRDRRQRAVAADLDRDPLEYGLRLLGREFMRDCPARRARGEAEPLLEIEIVDLVDDTVDIVRQGGALLGDGAVEGEHLLDAVAQPRQRIDRQAPSAKALDRLGVRLRHRRARLAPGIGEELERAPGGDRRIELAQRAGGAAARIGEDWLAGLLAL